MPPASMLAAFGIQMLIIDALRLLGYRAPIRISSLPRGTPMRPGIYSIIEDICAVDGSGGTEFRQRLNLRYMASHYFRQMLHRLTLFWAIGGICAAAATTAMIFTIEKNAAYVVRVYLVCFHLMFWPSITDISHRLAGLCHLLGQQCGPSSPPSGCREVWITSTGCGRKIVPKHRLLSDGLSLCISFFQYEFSMLHARCLDSMFGVGGESKVVRCAIDTSWAWEFS